MSVMELDNKPHKFYVIEFTPKKYKLREPDDVLMKFGITSKMDVLQRFNSYYDERYKDFDIKVKFSKYFSNKALAESVESYWLNERYPNPGPNKVWVEKYLNCEDNNRYDDSGITEVRLMKRKEFNSIIVELYNTLSRNDKELKEEAKLNYV